MPNFSSCFMSALVYLLSGHCFLTRTLVHDCFVAFHLLLSFLIGWSEQHTATRCREATSGGSVLEWKPRIGSKKKLGVFCQAYFSTPTMTIPYQTWHRDSWRVVVLHETFRLARDSNLAKLQLFKVKKQNLYGKNTWKNFWLEGWLVTLTPFLFRGLSPPNLAQ